MPDARAATRRVKKKELAVLKDLAITALERRGYEVRGKTTSQIREILRHHPTGPKAAA
ncbi:MAG: hypothetical protein PSV22_09610 [Pseudolabrys sp.]|jgi:hypothetical protein|nr:hypothetical protein [Pseudolabrys sp.]